MTRPWTPDRHDATHYLDLDVGLIGLTLVVRRIDPRPTIDGDRETPSGWVARIDAGEDSEDVVCPDALYWATADEAKAAAVARVAEWIDELGRELG
jgi:hypothetical protein